MNPIEAGARIEQRLQDYVRRALPVERSMPAFKDKLDDLFRDYRMARDPYLEIVPPYERGCTLAALADQQVIHPDTAAIFAKAFREDGDPKQVFLHGHQEQAIREVCQHGQNLVVCSGTGSGKTEAFLIPLIDYLVRQHAAGQLNDGVRAMILYPMNALVNDQIRRLRGILRYADFITFGKFTGQTEEESDLTDDFLNIQAPHLAGAINENALGAQPGNDLGFDDESPLPNEVTTRARWRLRPAHILHIEFQNILPLQVHLFLF